MSKTILIILILLLLAAYYSFLQANLPTFYSTEGIEGIAAYDEILLEEEPVFPVIEEKSEAIILAEIQEELDDIAEKIDVLREEIEKLRKEHEIEEIVEELEEEVIEEVIEEEEFKKVEAAAVEMCNIPDIRVIPQRNLVVFNEIAWMGTFNSSSDEWIELKNLTVKEMNLDGWQIIDKDYQIEIVFDSDDIIPIREYFLLERTDDNSVPFLDADKIYSGSLNDSGEVLYLFDSNCLLHDKVAGSLNWPGGSKPERKTMERTRDLSWQTYFGLAVNDILGTPKKRNSFVPVFDNIGIGSKQQETITEQVEKKTFVIQRVQLEDDEFVELYNPTDSKIDLTGCYFSYFSSNREWNNPYRNKPFPEGAVILSQDFYLIGLKGYPNADWQAYTSAQLNGQKGSLAIFPWNPKDKTNEQAEEGRIDAVGWGDTIVKEGDSITGDDCFIRKKLGWDTDNNLEDFVLSPEACSGN